MSKNKEVPKGVKPYKVILIGPQAVGKSSLLHRIIESKFEENYTATIGVDFKMVVVQSGLKKVILQIWDTAGQ
jgi:small GTP-binding protein